MDVLSFAPRRGVLFSKGIHAKCLTVSSDFTGLDAERRDADEIPEIVGELGELYD
jgi:hypothetical protein